MFKTNFSEHNRMWWHKKDLGVTAPEFLPRVRAWAEPSPESLSKKSEKFFYTVHSVYIKLGVIRMIWACVVCNLDQSRDWL